LPPVRFWQHRPSGKPPPLPAAVSGAWNIFDQLEGVAEVISSYTGGGTATPATRKFPPALSATWKR